MLCSRDRCVFAGRGRGKRSLSPVLMNEARYQKLMTRHKKRKVTAPDAPELRTAGITLSDVMVRTYMPRGAVTENSGGQYTIVDATLHAWFSSSADIAYSIKYLLSVKILL